MSANSGAEILNHVFVEGQTAGGERLVVERWQPAEVFDVVQPLNPSATVDATGWTPGAECTLTRVTGTFDSAPASFEFNWNTGGTAPTGTLQSASVTTPLVKDRRYVLRMKARDPSAMPYHRFSVHDKDTNAILGDLELSKLSVSTWDTIDVGWVQPADSAGYYIKITARVYTPSVVGILRFDSVTVARSRTTLVDRRGFTKSRTLVVGNRITEASAARLGDLYLDQHKTTPFQGSFKVTGVGGVRRVLGGQAVHPAWLGRDVGQLVRATHIIDPDTGGVGRDARIKTVAYDHNTLTATVTLSSDRGGFDALLAQLSVVVGQ